MSQIPEARPSLLGRIASAVVLPVVLALVTTITTGALTRQPNIEHAEAAAFLHKYYRDVFTTDEAEQERIWRTYQTDTYRMIIGHDLASFRSFYSQQVSKVDVRNVSPGSTANQFAVALQFTKRSSGKMAAKESFIFWLKCTDGKARFLIFHCPADRIQIDIVIPAE